ncbi:uncharacterized protein [Rutidosis leptorrhynchoides]|uniref:uncharacterized protein n=1 Tax=Rutidosis leptorrhynchoides TaxID=125765 RepID=UPI003A990494
MSRNVVVFVGKAFGLDQNELKSLVSSQPDAALVKLQTRIKFPEPSNKHIKENTDQSGETFVNEGGIVNFLTKKNIPMLGEIGLSAKFLKLEANAMLAPSYLANGSVQVSYVVKGSGQIRVVGSEGKLALDAKVGEGKLALDAKVEEGQKVTCLLFPNSLLLRRLRMILEWKFFLLLVFGRLAGNSSIWKALSPIVLQSAPNNISGIKNH